MLPSFAAVASQSFTFEYLLSFLMATNSSAYVAVQHRTLCADYRQDMCNNVDVENQGDDWHKAVAERIGKAVATRRKAVGLTAQQLAERCRELGAPIHRTTVTKIENGRPRFDLGELLILSVALDIPPALLVFPDYPDGFVEVVPGVEATNETAVDWLAGRDTMPDAEGNIGTALVRALMRRNEFEDRRARADLDKDIDNAGVKGVAAEHDRVIKRLTDEINNLSTVVRFTKAELWGGTDD